MFSVYLPVSICRTISAAALTVLLAVMGSKASQAADIDIQLATDYAVDPNTGAKVPATLNPSGTAVLSYIGNGITFRYVGQDGKSHTLKVHLDFEFLLNSDPNNKLLPRQSSTKLIKPAQQ